MEKTLPPKINKYLLQKNQSNLEKMVGLPFDCLANPLGAVRLTFDKAISSSGTSPLDGKDWGTSDLFRQFLFQENNISQVPLLDHSSIKWVQPNTLVRFRGMVQDMLGNEFYVGAYKDGEMWKTNKFTDVSPCSIDSSSNTRIWERQLFYCVQVPGQNSWVEQSEGNVRHLFANSSSPQREKRRREDDVIGTDMDMLDSGHILEESPNAKKMREEEMTFASQMTVTEGTSFNPNSTPYSETTSLPCLVKIYDSPGSDLKLNDIYEFVGVFTFDPELTGVKDDDDDLMQSLCEDASASLSPTKVPRLHCLYRRKLVLNDFLSSPPLELNPCGIKEQREVLVRHLTQVLGDDSVAAQYMLLHLLSKVHARIGTIAVGKLSINLTGFNQESMSVFGNRIKDAIKNLLPFTQCLPLTVDYLNTVSFAPKKDYNTNRLVSGILQLAEGSHLTIDETLLQAGTLNSTGVENVRVLKNLMDSQNVEYDFTYYKMEMAADVQLLILSEGKSNILPADIILPFRPCSVDSTSEVNEELVKAWRCYLASMKSLSHTIEPDMQKVVENDLVAARQADRSLGSEEFSRWLTMGRLMSVSYGESCLSMEHWQMVRELERLRKERLPR